MSRSRVRNGLEYGLFRSVRAVLDLLPERAALALGASLGVFAGSVLRMRRSAVDAHLRWVFPGESRAWRRRVARACYAHLGREAVVTFRLMGWSPERVVERTTMVGFEAFRDAYEQGGGVVLLTGHVGNWEIGGASIAARGLPIDVVGKTMRNPGFDAALHAVRARLGMRVMDMEDAPKGVLRSLRNGRVAAMLGDQNAHRGGMFVPVFGRLASTARGPALFALRSGAPLFLGVARREPGSPQRYTVTLEPVRAEPTGDPDEDVRALTRAHVAALEEVIRSIPEQYFWMHKRWKKRPPEEQASEPQVISR